MFIINNNMCKERSVTEVSDVQQQITITSTHSEHRKLERNENKAKESSKYTPTV